MENDAKIATPDELREFWTAMIRDSALLGSCRLKASEYLGKSLGMFIEKREITASGRPVQLEIRFDD